jgi:hypothetical protein
LRKIIFCLLCAVFCLLCSGPLFAEQHGQVIFAGVPIPGATVTLTQAGKALVTVTDQMGMYTFPDVPEGMWPIEIDMLGFAKLKGDTSTAAWELKMLPMEEIHAEVAHNDPAPAPAPAASAPAATGIRGSRPIHRRSKHLAPLPMPVRKS